MSTRDFMFPIRARILPCKLEFMLFYTKDLSQPRLHGEMLILSNLNFDSLITLLVFELPFLPIVKANRALDEIT